MALYFECINCNINQALKILKESSVSRKQQEELIRELLNYLSKADYELNNPALMEETYAIITKYIGNSDPYVEIKEYYDVSILSIYNELKDIIHASSQPFYTALCMAITGNLIDFNARHTFSLEQLKRKLEESENLHLDIDDSQWLYKDLLKAKSLLYIGDNCGEIVLDKLFIQQIKKECPNIKVYYGVRGKPIVNDVTIKDALLIKMNEVAEIIDNGNGALGTVLQRCSKQFKEVFIDADVVIAKGQGNYESLYLEKKSSIYFNFMIKCQLMADIIGVKVGSIVCLKNKKDKWR